jgi:flagellar L-ring protein precursor FlgH
MNKKIILILSFFVLVSCQSTVERLKRVGKDPELANIELPEVEEDEEDNERNEARIDAHHAYMQKTNSLWQPGSTKFFRDSRAWRIGDIITVIVQIQDQASLNNETNQKRNGKDTLGIPNFFGKEKSLSTAFSSQGDNNNLVGINSSRIQSGGGNITRKEAISTAVAATVTKILPSGNLVIQGHQEIRVNGELREVKVGGIIRPKDITTDNSIQTNQIAEARISYGGRGVVSDVQQPRVGSQVLDIISPF